MSVADRRMPRGPRLDVADALYHVIARGVERRPIFRTEPDRADFLRRLQGLAGKEDVRVFAFALMATHFHLVLRRGRATLAHFMRRLLTG
jgi:putative transposase